MADSNQYPMTPEAYENLKEELRQKQEEERPKLAARLKAAIEMGDLSENADYIAAKEAQGFLEGRIQDLQTMIRNAYIIDEDAAQGDTVRLGSHIKVQEDGEDTAEAYQIVGQVEANPRQGKISDESPLGQALLGHKVGDTVRVKAPAGDLVFKIVEIG